MAISNYLVVLIFENPLCFSVWQETATQSATTHTIYRDKQFGYEKGTFFVNYVS